MLAFFHRSDALQRGSRLLVQAIGLELHPDAAERLERVTQQHRLGLRVDRRALPARRYPGPPDLT
jgi:hypothetical protein